MPLAAAARPRPVSRALLAACALAAALVAASGPLAAYSPDAPQRLMVFHTRRTDHSAPAPTVDTFYWVPELDDNTALTLRHLGGELGTSAAAGAGSAACARRVWCGAPYYLPVLTLVPRARAAPSAAAPRVALAVNVTTARVGPAALELTLRLAGAQHAVVIVSPAARTRLARAAERGGERALELPAPLESARWAGRRSVFLALHDARAPRPFLLTLRLEREGAEGGVEGGWAELSVAGHALFGRDKLAAEHARLLAALPATVAATGWGVDLHLYSV